jgi:hypothetical protein
LGFWIYDIGILAEGRGFFFGLKGLEILSDIPKDTNASYRGNLISFAG